MANPGDFDFYCEEILSGKTPVKKVYESKKVLAFKHTKPAFEIHIVIIPKEHIHDLRSLEERHNKLIREIIFVARDLSRKLNKDSKGIRLVTNLGMFQETPHLHFHLISGKQIK